MDVEGEGNEEEEGGDGEEDAREDSDNDTGGWRGCGAC